MKKSLFALALVASLSAQATTVKEVFGPLQNKSACFGKTYTDNHLRNHPHQTVKKIRVKLEVMREFDSPLISVLVTQKNAPAKKLRQAMVCNDIEGKVICAVDCDGGSVEIQALEEEMLTLKNNGLIVKGGCGEEEDETVYLHDKKGGDDIFVLTELPAKECKDVPFPRQ